MKETAKATGIEGRILNLSSIAHLHTYNGGIQFYNINDKARYIHMCMPRVFFLSSKLKRFFWGICRSSKLTLHYFLTYIDPYFSAIQTKRLMGNQSWQTSYMPMNFLVASRSIFYLLFITVYIMPFDNPRFVVSQASFVHLI